MSKSDDMAAFEAEPGMRTAMRVVFPRDGDFDALPIYVDGGDKRHVVRLHPDDLIDRRRYRVRSGDRVSFGSYFNAFPAGYWQRWTVATAVRLRVRTSGSGSLIVYMSNGKGASRQVDRAEIINGRSSTFDLPLKTFGDGGFYWFELIGGGDGLVLEEADWLVSDHTRPRSKVTLGVTTFNRSDFCVRTIDAVASDENLRGILHELVIVDQGSEKLRNDEGFDEVASKMGDQLRVIEQPNLGGSGGFSRCMYEALTEDQSSYVILLDDDIILESESIDRLVTFADLCRKPTIVGGHMFDMHNRDRLHTYGEIVNPFYWQPACPGSDQYLNHEFGRTGLRYAKWMHQRVDVDYNGWWMCLIPISVIKEIGLSLPIFIKWDDSEYGLRAKQRGIATVSLPGACVWHISWGDKDDLVGWQAYFHARNRLITAMMYSVFPRGSSMPRTAYLLDLKHTVSMQYYTSTGRIMALEDVLAGPDQLHEILPKRLGEIRAMVRDFSDAQVAPDVEAFPEVRNFKPRKPSKQLADGQSLGITSLARKGAVAIVRQTILPEDGRAHEHPQAHIPHKDNKWYNVARNESAIVSVADGTGVSWYKRDRKLARSLAARTSFLHAQIVRRWPTLGQQYRDARDELTSVQAWEATFGITRSADE